MNKYFCRLIGVFLCIVMAVQFCVAVDEEQKWECPFSDITTDMWSYSYIKDLTEAEILPKSKLLSPHEYVSRGEFVSYLYALDQAIGRKDNCSGEITFSDVFVGHPYYSAIRWGKLSGIVNGVSETQFAPDAALTREHICTLLIRYADYAKIKLEMKQYVSQFVDSLRISDYAKTPVVACQMAGIVNGYDNGYFRPDNRITREEAIAVVWRVFNSAANVPDLQSSFVSTSEGVYDVLYNYFKPAPDPLVYECDPVELSYFDKVAFVGDSVSVRLQYYCAATNSLGNATFLCAGSLSATNALVPVGTATVHPSYQGKKMLVEDCVEASGAEIVYIMLGINNISFGVDSAVADMIELISRIQEKSPDVQIIIQSVTPMAETSTIVSARLNNERITQYNQMMKQQCEERGWYYVNVSEVMTDANGYLISEYCSDNYEMGIHCTNAAAEVWVEYLKTHVPLALIE